MALVVAQKRCAVGVDPELAGHAAELQQRRQHVEVVAARGVLLVVGVAQAPGHPGAVRHVPSQLRERGVGRVLGVDQETQEGHVRDVSPIPSPSAGRKVVPVPEQGLEFVPRPKAGGEQRVREKLGGNELERVAVRVGRIVGGVSGGDARQRAVVDCRQPHRRMELAVLLQVVVAKQPVEAVVQRRAEQVDLLRELFGLMAAWVEHHGCGRCAGAVLLEEQLAVPVAGH